MPSDGSETGKVSVLLGELERLHAGVDREARVLARRHRDRLQCRAGCAGCCIDGLTVFDVEAERIRRRHAALLANDEPHPAGACAFLDAGERCRIYEDRPYVCRTQGLPLRWIDEGPQGEPVELRDICPLNERECEPLDTLEASDCWTIGPVEERLAQLARRHGGSSPRRVALRDLFRRTER